jgi:inosine-uridine nucleoside N-ribohydrolase
LSLGGFTNVAKMLELYPDSNLGKLKGIYTMAGAVFVDGNVQALNDAQKQWDQRPIYCNWMSVIM